MFKPISAMSDHEMLVELLKEKRRNDRARNFKYMIAGACIVLIVILLAKYLPPVITFFRRIDSSLDQVQQGIGQVQDVADGIKDSVSSLLERLSNLLHWN